MAEPQVGSDVAEALRQGKRRMLVQSEKDAAKWEALQLLGDGPQDFARTELDTRGAARYQQDGGFEVVPRAEFDGELLRLSEALRAQRGEVGTPPTQAELLRQQVMERSGAGAPGRVYAEEDGELVQLPLESAEQRGLRVIDAAEAQELGEAAALEQDLEAASMSDGERILRSLEAGVDPIQQQRAKTAQGARGQDSRMLANALRSGR